MRKLKNSLIAQYLLIILIATMMLPITVTSLSVIFFNTMFKEDLSDRYYNGTDLEAMWHKTAKGLSGASKDQIHLKLSELKIGRAHV